MLPEGDYYQDSKTQGAVGRDKKDIGLGNREKCLHNMSVSKNVSYYSSC